MAYNCGTELLCTTKLVIRNDACELVMYINASWFVAHICLDFH